MTSYEARLRTARLTIRDLCKEAGIAASNWGRWKRGTSPTFSKWGKVEAAAGRLLPEVSAVSTASPGDSPSRAAAASLDPSSETEESLTPVRGVGDPVATPAQADG
jgi:hypothetical protein